MNPLKLTFLSRVTATTLLFHTAAPLALSAKDEIGTHVFRRALYKKLNATPEPLAGLPLLKPGVAAPPPVLSHVPKESGRAHGTRLGETGRFELPVSEDEARDWRRELANPQTSRVRREWLRLWLAESELNRKEPDRALQILGRLLASKPSAEVAGLARYDRALALFYSGRYAESEKTFKTLLRSNEKGFDRRNCALWVRHAAACAGYHRDNDRLGIPQPTRLDPLCGAAALATCLRAMKLPHDKPQMERVVPHTGEGSDMKNLMDACDRLGVASHPVEASAEGLKKMPLPAVAFVEGDHFVAVVEADDKGVEYVCSDCGAWPGGPIRVSWEQWRAMKAGVYLAVVRKDDAEDLALRRLTASKTRPNHAIRPDLYAMAPGTQGGSMSEASRIVAALAGAVTAYLTPTAASCGSKMDSGHCFDTCCPIDEAGPAGGGGQGGGATGGGAGGPSRPGGPASGGGMGGGGGSVAVVGGGWFFGPSAGDPVNLATGEEEYTPPADLTVYNPKGPSLTLRRLYNSLSIQDSGFGMGWSHGYNLRVENVSSGGGPLTPSEPDEPTFPTEPTRERTTKSDTTVQQNRMVVPGTPGGGGASFSLVLPNNAKVAFNYTGAAPTVTNPKVAFPVPAGRRLLATWEYDAATGGTYFAVTFPDRTKYVFENLNSNPNASFYGNMLKRIVSPTGQAISFQYAAYHSNAPYCYRPGWGYIRDVRRLTQISDDTGNPLLTFANDSFGNHVSATDRYGRRVYYEIATPPVTNDAAVHFYYELGKVSQIVPSTQATGSVRHDYGYTGIRNGYYNETVPFLNRISVPSPTGTGLSTATINYDYNTGFVSSVVDANGNRREYSATDALGNPDANKSTVKVKDAAGNVVRQYTVGFSPTMGETGRWNGSGQLVSSTGYGSAGATYKPASATDGNARSWSVTRDQFGNVLTSTTPKGTVTTYTYDYTNFPLGELTSIKQGSKTPVSYSYYQPSGFIREVSTPIPGDVGTGATQTTTYAYTAMGNLASVTTPGNNAASARSLTFGYTSDGTYSQAEAFGQPIRVTDAMGKATHLRYDVRGNVVSSTDALGIASSSTFNLADQPVTSLLPATGNTGSGNAVQANVYLYVGGPTLRRELYDESNALARTVSMAYGPEGETLSRTGSTEAVTLSFDGAYDVKTLSDGNGATTTYYYDLSGRTTKIAFPGATGQHRNQALFTSYDSLGNLLSRTDGNGGVVNYAYNDPNGLLSSVSYVGASANDVSFSYDQYGRATSVTDGAGTTTTTYDDDDHVSSTTRTYSGLAPQTTTYAYWPDGSRKSMTNVAGTWTYAYDAAGRYASLVSPAGTSSATYLDNGWLVTRTVPNGAKTTFSYDALGRLNGMANKTSSGATLSEYGLFGYDAGLNFATFTSSIYAAPAQGGVTTYVHDAKNRLTQEYSTRNGQYAQSFAYDAAGNATTFKGAARTFNSDNQLNATGLSYDGNGNPLSNGGNAVAFDPENRMVSRGTSWTAGYRADGLRAWKQSGSNRTYYLYDGGKPVVEMNASGAVTAINVYSPDGLSARKQDNVWTSYVFDPRGNVAQRLDASQGVRSSSAFDAYGTETVAGSWSADCFGYNARWGYVADKETGLYYCQNRYYDVGTGRWLTKDPIEYSGGVNLYAYCMSGPIGSVDANGLKGLKLPDLKTPGGVGKVIAGIDWVNAAVECLKAQGSAKSAEERQAACEACIGEFAGAIGSSLGAIYGPAIGRLLGAAAGGFGGSVIGGLAGTAAGGVGAGPGMIFGEEFGHAVGGVVGGWVGGFAGPAIGEQLMKALASQISPGLCSGSGGAETQKCAVG